MKLIVGLGNPGRKYEQTRHNIGFMVAAKVASLAGAGPSKVRFEGEFAEGTIGGEKLVILWPQTYMNASGSSVRKACDFYKLPPPGLLVISDDLNLKTGRVRIRPSGSAGGQNGLADIIRHLGTDEFARLRIGIDRPPPQWTTTDYVLGKFNKDETDKIELAIERATKAALTWASEGVAAAMSRYNADPTAQPTKQPTEKKTDRPQTEPKQTPADANRADTDTTEPESKTD
jgi:PTH1 family peptidyl-tRNA hydrolase